MLKLIKKICGKSFILNILYVLKGYAIYKSLISKYGKNCKIYVCQHPGTGDVYLQAKYVDTYAKKHNVENYVFTVIGNSIQVAKLFPVQKIEKLTQSETNWLVCFYKFVGINVGIEILHYHGLMQAYSGFLGYIRNFKKMNFNKMMLNFVFSGIENEKFPLPNFSKDETYTNEIFKKYNLKSKKTVLIAPYANSLKQPPLKFWEALVKRLNSLGYTVCTNSSGNNEQPIKDSFPVFIPYKFLKSFLQAAGYSITLRSGLSDVISEIPHKKVVIYMKQQLYSTMFGLGTSYEYFSLNTMELCHDAIEFEYDEERNMRNLITSIVNSIYDSNFNGGGYKCRVILPAFATSAQFSDEVAA